eukprot:Clim_evm79s147 gene=Clim_evmTU79s147
MNDEEQLNILKTNLADRNTDVMHSRKKKARLAIDPMMFSGEKSAILDGYSDFRAFMREQVPDYIGELVEAMGFDTPEILAATFDTTRGSKNTVDDIERYVTETYTDQKVGTWDPASGRRFLFPPGHRAKLLLMVERVREMVKQNQANARNRRGHAKPIIGFGQKNLNDSDLKKLEKLVAEQIEKWALKRHEYGDLKKDEDYKIEAVRDIRNPTTATLSVTCMTCQKRNMLANSNGRFVVSNWTRHVMKECPKTKNRELRPASSMAPPVAAKP